MSRTVFYCRCGARLEGASARLSHQCPPPEGAEGERCFHCDKSWEVRDDGVPYCAECWRSVNGQEAATPWAGTCSACASHCCGHTGKPGTCPVAAAVADAWRNGAAGFTQPQPALAFSVTLPAPAADAGGKAHARALMQTVLRALGDERAGSGAREATDAALVHLNAAVQSLAAVAAQAVEESAQYWKALHRAHRAEDALSSVEAIIGCPSLNSAHDMRQIREAIQRARAAA